LWRAVRGGAGKLPRFSVYYVSAADTYGADASAGLLRRHYPRHARLAGALAGRQAFFDWGQPGAPGLRAAARLAAVAAA